MGLLDNTAYGAQSARSYYSGEDFGGYQFTSLEVIINQFMIAYVGENKIIPKIKKIDVAFHAQRAMQELSFDTFKSIKAQQIDVPATLVMPLPQDYVNYTKISWVDSAGIKHPIYSTKHTSNPFQIKQNDDGSYNFDYETLENGILKNSDFSSDLTDTWNVISAGQNLGALYIGGSGPGIEDGKLKFSYHVQNGYSAYNWGHVHAVYQAINVADIEYLDISADGIADTITLGGVDNPGTLRFGISTQIPENNFINNTSNVQNEITAATYTSNNINTSIFDLFNIEGEASYLEWVGPASDGSTSETKELLRIDVTNQSTVYAVIISFVDFQIPSSTSVSQGIAATKANSIDNLVVTRVDTSDGLLVKEGNEKNSSTWENYKSSSPSENNNDDYEDDVYWPYDGKRYGLEPSHAQANGSFFIDQRLGRIHFSSNISGKTVILDYISDSLGTDAEMHVHKFAEEAMYKWIAHAIISTSSYGQPLVRRLKQEKFAAVRNAKLRLSNLKLEELTQMLRDKSKWIKH